MNEFAKSLVSAPIRAVRWRIPGVRGTRATLRANPAKMVKTEILERHAERYGTAIGDVAALLLEEGFKPDSVEGQAILRPMTGIVRSDVIWMRPPP